MVNDKILDCFLAWLGKGPEECRPFHAAIEKSLDSVETAFVVIANRVIDWKESEFERMALDRSYHLMPENRHAASGNTDSLMLDLLRETFDGSVLRRFYMNDSPKFIEWKKIFRCDDGRLYGQLDVGSVDCIESFIDGCPDFVHLLGMYPRHQDECDFENPLGAAITVCDSEGYLVLKFRRE